MAEGNAQIALGTVQWGVPYGIGNTAGPPSNAELSRMLRAAIDLGINVLDTARAYGEAESRIGTTLSTLDSSDAFRIVTKVSPQVFGEGDGDDLRAAQERIRASVAASIEALAPARIDTLLIHRSDHRTAARGRLWDVMQRFREQGAVSRIGVSALSPPDAFDALEDESVDVMQVPGSLLDQRLARAGFFEAARDRGVEVHVRSVYLQGLAFLEPHHVPPHLAACISVLEEMRAYAAHEGREAAEVWLDYARTLPVDYLVIGTESEAQLMSNAHRFRQPRVGGIDSFAAQLPLLGDDVLDPARWSG